ncbi:hypothetical protein [Parapedobacter lycopersici]|uniref:hypothetical protein n=1 Tax=Parapedobacter lycopersici TaxID=1864939 RepID=UPI003340270A
MKKVGDSVDELGNDTAPLLKMNRFVFVVMEGKNRTKVAIEGNYGMVAFANNMKELKEGIVDKVQEQFQGKFVGEICIRRFVDTIIKIAN